jgi:phage terminase large subunit-like protein
MIQKRYYAVPLEYLPFQDIPSLENTKIKVGHVSFVPLSEKGNYDLHLVTIYDNFNENATVEELRESPFLCGQLLAEPSASRGKVKFRLIGSEEVQLSDEDYPDMKYSKNIQQPTADYSSGNWFYVEKGNYYILAAIKSDFAKVRHLESMVMHTDIRIRLRIVIELLRRNVKNGLINLNEENFKEIGALSLKADPLFRTKDKDQRVKRFADTEIPPMLSVPIWDDIPEALRGRAIK